jgi:hypothetical protein
MEKDFHFFAIYALARSVGFIPEHAHTVAYASQHTDDAMYEQALEFENGGRFQQVLTAHKYLDLESLSKDVCYRIWIPFHFLPGDVGVEFYDRMLTRAGSTVAQRLLDDILASQPKPYLLHRLGIFLHTYGDTWSHQNFLGLLRDDLNDVKNLEVTGESWDSLQSIFERLKRQVLEYCAPKLGHTQAGTIPDEPYREWRYENFSGKSFHIFNVERALDAARNCYQVLTKFSASFPAFASSKALPWHEIAGKIEELFQTKGDLDSRCRTWANAISQGQMRFRAEDGDLNIVYDDREWFRKAVKVEKNEEGKDRYIRNPGFETSHWKYFHDAAALHGFTVLHEVLPEHGMICG